jgi:hypothetical protein
MTPLDCLAKPHYKKVVDFNSTGPVYKSTDFMGRPCFAVDGQYTLENGEFENARVTTQKKKDILSSVERRKQHAKNGNIQLDGKFEVISYSLF